MVHIHLAADLFTIGHNLTTRLAGLAGAILILFIGVKALGHIGNDRHGAAVGLILVALIPAWFIFDPTGAESALKSAVHAIGG